MDEVDRLFQCFKCGISPPQSAFREQRKGKRKLKLDHSPQLQTPAQSLNKKPVKEFSPVVFYGSPCGVPPKRPARLLRLLQEIRVDLAEQNKSKEEVWKTFPRQDEAIKFLKTLGSNVRVFSYQDHLKGQRRFLVVRKWNLWSYSELFYPGRLIAGFPTQCKWRQLSLQEQSGLLARPDDSAVRVFLSLPAIWLWYYFSPTLVSSYKEFWRRYSGMNPKFRHHYEIIQEGLPCHLYFDLEFNKKENVDRNGDEMVDLLIVVIFDALLEKYSIQGTDDLIVELDSSTAEKFSRHLVVRLPKAAFKDNLHVGAFVAEICARVRSYRETDKRYENLFISKGSSSAESCQLFVDTAVYSRNRCFRLPFSSKAGKTSILIPSGRFKCTNMSEEQTFMASLICNMDADIERVLICKMDMDCVKSIHFDSEVTDHNKTNSLFSQNLALNNFPSDASSSYLMEKSPFPALDVFIEAIASRGSVSGKIRSWYLFSEYGLMVYSMSRSRYCERIGREHKSNHVIYVVDVRRAVYYQKCHDPDCRGYRSDLRSVPDDIIPDPPLYSNVPGENNEVQAKPKIGEESMTDSCQKWWVEAIKVAEQVESMHTGALDFTQMDYEKCEEEDEEWWMAVETAAAQLESAYLQQPMKV